MEGGGTICPLLSRMLAVAPPKIAAVVLKISLRDARGDDVQLQADGTNRASSMAFVDTFMVDYLM